MSNVKVVFLNQDYSIPEELQEFVGFLQYFENIRDRIMPLLTDQIKKKDYSGGADADFIYFKKPLSKIGDEVIADLATKGIFDVTLDDIVYTNKGYIQLHNVCSETIQGMTNILLNAMTDWLDGYNNAYSSAASTITGSGVSIWTNSITSALIYSAMEASTIKKQANQADIQYRNAMASLNTNITNRQEREETNLLKNKYYPGVAEALNLFVSEMMEYYLAKLQEKGIFDYSQVKKYNLKRSSDLLNNIKLVPDKVGLLRESFTVCPYNPDVYNAVLNNHLADYETFETAKYFHQDEVLCDVIEKYIKSNLNNYDRVKPIVKILASYKNQSESYIWKSLYYSTYQRLHQHYKELDSVISSRNALIEWIKENITKDAVKLVDMDSEKLSAKVNRIVFKRIISEEQFILFIELGMLSEDFCSVEEYNSLNEINEDYSKRILEVIGKLICDLRKKIEENQKEYEMAKQKYDEALNENNRIIKELEGELSNLKYQRSSLGVFAFSKKKEIDKRIDEIKRKLSEKSSDNSLIALKDEYERIGYIMHSFIV